MMVACVCFGLPALPFGIIGRLCSVVVALPKQRRTILLTSVISF